MNMRDLQKAHQKIEQQVAFISQIVNRSNVPLAKNISYLIQRGKFYGMTKIYESLGGTRKYKIYEKGL